MLCAVSYVADTDYMKFQQLLGPFLVDWRTTMHADKFLTTFQEEHICQHSWKIVQNPFTCMVVIHRKGKLLTFRVIFLL